MAQHSNTTPARRLGLLTPFPLLLAGGLGCGGPEEVEPFGEAPSAVSTMVYSNGFERGLEGVLCAGNCPTIDSSPTFAGAGAISFVLTRDLPINYRTEAVLGPSGVFEFGQEHWIGMAYRHEDYGLDQDTESSPLQVHTTPSSWASECSLGSAYSTAPVFLAVQNGELRVVTYGGVPMWSGPLEAGRWHRLVLRLRPSTGRDGLVEVWKDGEHLGLVTGANSPVLDKCGKPMRPPYFKMGIYKWNWKTKTTDVARRELLIDELKIARGTDGYALVVPGGGGDAGNPDLVPPSVPTNLRATAQSPSQVALSWTAASDNRGVTAYRVFQNGVLATTVAGTSHNFTGLTPATRYTYTVAAEDSAGNRSAPSEAQAVTTPQVPNQSNGLVAAYGFAAQVNGTIPDVSGQRNTLTLRGGAVVDRGLLALGGSGEHAEAASAASLDLSSGRATVSLWVNFEDTGRDQIFVAKPSNLGTPVAPYFSYALLGQRTAADRLRPRFWLTVGGRGVAVNSAEEIAPGWHFIAGTYDGVTMRIFVDGVEAGQRAATGAIARSGTPLRVGLGGGGGQPFAGRIDNLRIYERAQTAAQVRADMPVPIGTTN